MYKKESKKNIREDLVRVWNYSHELQRDGVMPVGTFHKHKIPIKVYDYYQEMI